LNAGQVARNLKKKERKGKIFIFNKHPDYSPNMSRVKNCPLFFPYVAILDPSHDNLLKDIWNVYTG